MEITAVLDASVVVAMLLEEPGGASAEHFIGSAAISTVNYSEVVARLADRGASPELAAAQIGKLALMSLAFDEKTALLTGALRSMTRSAGLSLGDCACLATARRYGVPAVTADRAWAELGVGVHIELIR